MSSSTLGENEGVTRPSDVLEKSFDFDRASSVNVDMTDPVDEAVFRLSIIERAGAASGPDVAMRIDRARGCLVGGAIGDALGAPVEFMSRNQILARFGPHGIQDFALAYGRMGAVTDDTQMTLFTAEGLLRAENRLHAKGIGPVYASITDAAYQRWLMTQAGQPGNHVRATGRCNGWLTTHDALFARRAPGVTCLRALHDKTSFGSPAVNPSKGCGGVMRVAPVGLFCATLALGSGRPGDRETFELGCEIAGLTHGHPTGQVTAGYLAVLVSALVGEACWDDATRRAWAQLVGAAGHEETADIVTRALEAAAECPWSSDRLASLGEGWIAEEALAISLYCAAGAARDARDSGAVRDALLLAVNHDGDSDSTGAITGNILGALLGHEALPPTWRDTVELQGVITEVADDLVTFPSWNVGEYISSPECDYWMQRYPPG